jgi:benzoyl-CoA reductase subunit C
VIRNLSGMFKILFEKKYVKYFDAPQNFDPTIGGKFYRHELETLCRDLERLNGVAISNERLRRSIALYNENRRLIMLLYALRSERPWLAPTSECYLLLRAGNLLPVEAHNELLQTYLDEVPQLDRRMLDNSRVVLTGAFCEQPPLGLIRTLERAGCYIVDDDFILISRWYLEPVPITDDPLDSLVDAYLKHSTYTAAKYDHENTKGQFLIDTVKRNNADGVIFCAPSFCDPALLDQPMLSAALDRARIPHTHFKYAENTGQFQVIREQAGTFSDSIKLWGEK